MANIFDEWNEPGKQDSASPQPAPAAQEHPCPTCGSFKHSRCNGLADESAAPPAEPQPAAPKCPQCGGDRWEFLTYSPEGLRIVAKRGVNAFCYDCHEYLLVERRARERRIISNDRKGGDRRSASAQQGSAAAVSPHLASTENMAEGNAADKERGISAAEQPHAEGAREWRIKQSSCDAPFHDEIDALTTNARILGNKRLRFDVLDAVLNAFAASRLRALREELLVKFAGKEFLDKLRRATNNDAVFKLLAQALREG